MKIYKPLWAEGVLLSPQHFQQQAAWEQFARETSAKLNISHPWGLSSIAWDNELLSLGKLKVTTLKACFPDGSIVDSSVSDDLPPARDIENFPVEAQSCEVLLGLPVFHANGQNLRMADDEISRPRRFFGEYVNIDDMFSENTEELLIARQTLHIIFDFEPHEDYICFPIARLNRDARGGFELYATYIPPVLSISSCQNLLNIVDRISDILLAKSAHLSERRTERNQSIADFSVSDVFLFWLLNAIHQNWPEFAHLKAHPQQHPERLYLAMARLFGSLSVFSTSLGLADLPVYNHLNLGECFYKLEEIIRDLLDTVVPSQVIVIELERLKPTQWRGRLHDQRLIENADYYLAVHADMPAHKIQEQLPMVCKIGSPDEVEHILNSAVIGVPIKPLARVPSAIPIRLENQYFALDGGHPSFTRMLEARLCSIYVPASIPNVTIELFAVVRS